MTQPDEETRLRAFERPYEVSVPDDMYLMIRVDGKGFSKYTSRFAKPFDARISDCLVEASERLVREFNASVGYTSSDEISVRMFLLILCNWCTDPITVLPPFESIDGRPPACHPFNGRTQKLASIAASLVTAVFNQRMQEVVKDDAAFQSDIPEVRYDSCGLSFSFSF